MGFFHTGFSLLLALVFKYINVDVSRVPPVCRSAGMSKILVGTILYGGPNAPPLIGIRLNYLAKTGRELVETSPHMFQWPYQVSSDKEVKRSKRKSQNKTR